jgi:hypothetical protein
LTVYDIAGLTRGASTGAGLGNAFLSHIRAVDAIFQVVRCFDDAEIIHVEGDVDPVRDLGIISEELRIKDIEFVEKNLEGLKKQTARGGQSLEMKKLKEEQATVEGILALLKDGKDVRKGNWGPKEVSFVHFFYVRHASVKLRRMTFMMIKSIIARRTNPSSSIGSIIQRLSRPEMNFNLTLSSSPNAPFPGLQFWVCISDKNLSYPGRDHQQAVASHR